MTEGSIPASSKVYSLSGNEKTLESRTSYRIVENPEYSRDNTSLLRLWQSRKCCSEYSEHTFGITYNFKT
jgi:hypothetical protein